LPFREWEWEEELDEKETDRAVGGEREVEARGCGGSLGGAGWVAMNFSRGVVRAGDVCCIPDVCDSTVLEVLAWRTAARDDIRGAGCTGGVGVRCPKRPISIPSLTGLL
jgi:hypothetical protein